MFLIEYSEYLLNRGENVVGIDNLNDYYDVNLKHSRLKKIANNNFTEKSPSPKVTQGTPIP